MEQPEWYDKFFAKHQDWFRRRTVGAPPMNWGKFNKCCCSAHRGIEIKTYADLAKWWRVPLKIYGEQPKAKVTNRAAKTLAQMGLAA